MRLTGTTTSDRRPRVLLIVADVSPETASGIMATLSAIGRVADVCVVTHAYNRIAVAAMTSGLHQATPAVAFVDASTGLTGWVKRKCGPAAARLFGAVAASLKYARFEEVLWGRMRDRLADGEFDLVHRLTPAATAIPSPIAPRLKALGVPFVLGPLVAPVYWPADFDSATPLDHPRLAGLRRLHGLLPGYRATLAAAGAILVGSHRAGRALPRTFRSRGRLMPTPVLTASASDAAVRRPVSRAKGPLRLLFTGTMTHENGVDLLLETVAPLVNAGKVTLDLVGDGPLVNLIHATIVRDGLGDGVHLHVGRRDLAPWHGRSDLLVLPGLRVKDATPVLQAMATGLPAVVAAHGAGADVVTADCGFLLPVAARSEMVLDLRDLLARLAAEPGHVASRSAKAQWHAHATFGADAAVTTIAGVYRATVAAETRAMRLAA